MARQYTVLSQVPPRATKAKAEPEILAPDAPRAWRVRAAAGPAVFEGTEAECRAWVAAHPEQRPVVECLVGAVYAPPARSIPTVAELAHDGMAHQTQDGKAWKVTPLGQDVLTDAMRGLDD